MPPADAAIGFVPLTAADLPMLSGWLAEAHVRAWWGDPEEELALIRATLDGVDGTEGFLFRVDGQPAGYIQSWKPGFYARDPEWLAEAPWLAQVPPDARGVDMFIGPPELLGKGLGGKVLRAFCARLFENGADHLIIDPDAANLRAVTAYQKAGFEIYGQYEGPEDTTILMQMKPGEQAHS